MEQTPIGQSQRQSGSCHAASPISNENPFHPALPDGDNVRFFNDTEGSDIVKFVRILEPYATS